MSKVWFCRNCGYEVSGRGRCHVCKQRLEESPLAELEPGAEEDEVGYRLEDWADHTRGNLIVALIHANVPHRFEEDELVVGAEDEEKVDDLVEQVAADAAAEEEEAALPPDELSGDVEQLLGASRRLIEDPTDMEADADTLESSSAVFLAESWYRVDDDTWAAVGRVTRRLLAALGAEEALEDEIKLQAGILTKLLGPSFETAGVAANGAGVRAEDGGPAEESAGEGDQRPEAEGGQEPEAEGGQEPEAADELDEADPPQAREGRRWGRRRRNRDKDQGKGVVAVEPDAELEGPDEIEADVAESDKELAGDIEELESAEDEPEPDEREGESVYELPDWLPEQRAHLSLMMDAAGITYVWETGDLVVPLARDTEVEELFGQVEGVQMDEDDEARYRALEALFAAADRFLNDPDSEAKAQEVVRAVEDADGPTPVGVDDGLWWSIRQQARTVASAIERDASLDLIFSETKELRDELRPLM